MTDDQIFLDQQQYWSNKASENFGKPQALGSESLIHKDLRYSKITDMILNLEGAKILDIGAGMGDFYGHLNRYFPSSDFKYTGVDITDTFCVQGRIKYPGIDLRRANFMDNNIFARDSFDFVVMSGLFHQHGSASKDQWLDNMLCFLDRGYELCNKALIFNVLNQFADFERPGNFHVNTISLQEKIFSRMSRFFELKNAYPLFETTFCVFKSSHIRNTCNHPSLLKYIG